jgi:hypothetical protein
MVPLHTVTTATQAKLRKSYAGFKTLNEFRTIFKAREPLDFISALMKTSTFLATDKRDQFYALLGLVHDGRLYIPTPSYTIEFDTLKAQMAINYLRVTHDLELSLLCNGQKTLSRSVPSWTPDWLRLDQLFDFKYATRQHAGQKFAAAGTSVLVAAVDRLDPRFTRVEILPFQQVDGLGTIYGKSGSSLIQTTSYGQVPDRISTGQRFKVVKALYCCLINGPDLRYFGGEPRFITSIKSHSQPWHARIPPSARTFLRSTFN